MKGSGRNQRGARAGMVIAWSAWIVAVASSAQARSGEPPVSQRLAVGSLAAVQKLEMPPVDVERLRAEDLINDQAMRPGPTRFAAQITVRHDLESSGTWEDLAGGSRLWRLRVASPGALSLNLGLRRFDVPLGAELWLYDPDGERVEGPYTWRDRSPEGELWTPVLLGDEVVLELHLPAGAGDARLEIGWVNHGYRFFGETDLKQGACNIDVVCPEVNPFRDQVRAVARYTRSGAFLCTGNMVNNTALDFRPLFLTAEHCGITPGNDHTVIVYWNYESPNCGDLSGGSLADNQVGSTWLADEFDSDFALVELNQMPAQGSNVFYAGWDATGATPQSVVGIHHPAGDEKAAAFDDDPSVSTDIGSGFESHWQVVWNDGTTEGGSSGSCIFDQTTKACVGHLTGGFASCADLLGPDFYGKISEAWTGDGTPQSRLMDWLDPVGGGSTTFLNGIDKVPPGPCVPDATTLCLPDTDRFRVTVFFSTTQGPGNSGDAQAIPLDAIGITKGGIFAFVDAQNPEFLVKVLDGCGINGRWWVFFAATTNVGFTLTVTDTVANQTRFYTNPDINPADAVTDTQAFATCP